MMLSLAERQAFVPRRWSGLRVLVVDDYPDAVASLTMLLEMWGHAVDAAGDVPLALERARRFRPDIVLAEIDLPGLDGYALADQLHRNYGDAAPLLVAITTRSRRADRQRAWEVGFHEYLVKPADPLIVRQLLEEAAEHRFLNDEFPTICD